MPSRSKTARTDTGHSKKERLQTMPIGKRKKKKMRPTRYVDPNGRYTPPKK